VASRKHAISEKPAISKFCVKIVDVTFAKCISLHEAFGSLIGSSFELITEHNRLTGSIFLVEKA
jgi:hypothetical protein